MQEHNTDKEKTHSHAHGHVVSRATHMSNTIFRDNCVACLVCVPSRQQQPTVDGKNTCIHIDILGATTITFYIGHHCRVSCAQENLSYSFL